ncbi:hypothetical protein GCM10027590_62800 [Nocardiopsis nanhaiensis]
MTASLRGASVVVIGGSSGIGLVTGQMAHEAGAQLTIAGRDANCLSDARSQFGDDVRTAMLDISDESSVKGPVCRLARPGPLPGHQAGKLRVDQAEARAEAALAAGTCCATPIPPQS